MNREHKWEIGVSSGSYYPSLTIDFGHYDLGLAYEDDHRGIEFYAYSYHIDELDDPKEVSRRLYSLNLLLSGALRIYFCENNHVETKFIYFIEPGISGPHEIWAETIEEYPFSRNPRIDQYQNPNIKPNSCFPSYLLYLSRTSEELRTLLFLCGLISTTSPLENILTWSTLYKIVDCVKHYSTGINVELRELVDLVELKKFTAACNNMTILGLNARHGAAGNPAPTNVITDINLAIKLILEMSNVFVKKYVQIKCS